MSVGPDPYAELAVEDECAAADQLLLAAIALLHQMQSIGRDEYVLTAALAAGTEKLAKLTLGFIRQDVNGGDWPSDELKRYGHDITGLHNSCVEFIEQVIDDAAAEMKIKSERLASDPHIAGILELVSDYAKGGRFYNLDFLGGYQGDRISVRQQWHTLLQAVNLSNESKQRWALMEQIETRNVPPSIPSGWTSSISLRSSVESWRDYYLTAWEHGLCGPRAQRLAANIAFMIADG